MAGVQDVLAGPKLHHPRWQE